MQIIRLAALIGIGAAVLSASTIDYVLSQSSVNGNTSPTSAGSSIATYHTTTGLSVSESGTTAFGNPSAPGATAAQTGADAPYGCCNVNGFPYGATVRNSADLATGAIHGSIVTDDVDGGGSLGELRDLLTFDNTTGSVADISVTWRIDGQMSVIPDHGAVDAFGDLVLGGEFQYTGHLDYSGNVVNDPHVATNEWVSYTVTPVPGAFGYVFTGEYALQPGTTQLNFQEILELGGGGGTDDFSNTSQVGLTLPAGVTMGSDSGVFLTASVPEPGTLSLLAAALLGLALTAKTRRM